jgi:FeS assembly SUF system regulator
MLRISKLADYATLIMSHLVGNPELLVSAAHLAHQLKLSIPVVSKILKILCNAGLLTSVRGAVGGYRLARAPEEISLADVVCAIEGNFAMTECCSVGGSCIVDASCTTKNTWKVINQVIYTALAKVSLKDLMQPL